ncbi:adenine nucleotide alpha hydrolase [Pseudemcibacter aquimaris]|uniref:adenine nucleotide alpha hydrolase n=1 Tax=Pseudemcibacter aquimaris TaxID=2857064 RepID=UPI002013610B|nr:adenine nucleotide alpha hydrolase [Pseudemcibacter aquimaris]MCC3859643.1 adenine nucleotide alpha hydrolase [Pseudemcibacter aquimaris]WDU60038.1 adenine nucleotide alpha hydrolase [Pseudemcibacter aquimaris]
MTANKPKAVVSWSSGKDSAYAYHIAKSSGDFDIVGTLTTITETFKRVSMHGVREELLDIQIQNTGLKGYKSYIPSPCTNEIYEEKMRALSETLKADGITHVIFGDLFLEDVRDYRLRQMEKAELECVFPLWKKDTTELAHEMIDSGLRSILTCIDPKKLDKSFAGREFGPALLADLPDHIDPCGENGEFHSVVIKGPMLKNDIPVTVGEIVERDGFIFADVIP